MTSFTFVTRTILSAKMKQRQSIFLFSQCIQNTQMDRLGHTPLCKGRSLLVLLDILGPRNHSDFFIGLE
uniref:Ovule protein n=1 Tax=Caenorhabditis tropicalis TaxID=1561998 RepID=A0A1I7UWK9_9PELO